MPPPAPGSPSCTARLFLIHFLKNQTYISALVFFGTGLGSGAESVACIPSTGGRVSACALAGAAPPAPTVAAVAAGPLEAVDGLWEYEMRDEFVEVGRRVWPNNGEDAE